MKKIILTSILLFVSVINSQTLVVDEKFKENNYPIAYNFLPNLNRLVIQKGKNSPENIDKTIKNIFSYDSDGFVETLIKNEEYSNCIFSPIENTFLLTYPSKLEDKTKQYKIIANGKSAIFNKSDEYYQYFNDEYEFSVLNQENNENINLEKDNIFLSVTNLVTRENKKIKLNKLDIWRLKNSGTTNYSNDLTFGVRVNEYKIGFVTKSIAKDYKSSVLYRNIFSYNGYAMDDFAYKIQIPNKNLIYSNNGGGYIYTNPQTGDTYISDLAINNFVVDSKTEEVYVYGLFGESAKNASNISNKPTGFYVFKFDKTGNKIWELVENINDKEDFNANQNVTNIKLNFTIRNKHVLFSITTVNEKKGYLHYAFLDKETGNISKTKKINFNVSTVNTTILDDKFVKSYFNKDNVVNKNLDLDGLIAQEDNLVFANYLNSLQISKKLFLKTFYAKNGIWLLETDNTEYFKINFFKE